MAKKYHEFGKESRISRYRKSIHTERLFDRFNSELNWYTYFNMTKMTMGTGVVHSIPKDLRLLLQSNADVLELWNGLTPLARNEWICWVTIVKKSETRAEHLTRLCVDLRNGKRRPCCWPGCPHRRPSAQKWFKKKK